ncbi:Maf family protein [Fulvimonas soli]|jgi:septum formation protein|uniref:dTTP/UTP pyrophosphatase n=1 Tax=Fulvimonas soli TaxID=155197 RepID=A0A316I2D8_9GAMM|nr:Maf family protein [Fulvimonas soli]PWK87604.1 septum formation protein [Fulvimonas soli]TNY26779.1 septum formation inhibitor Maf [Fulvimonas soli]
MLYLASQSPRRRELLAQLGYRFEVVDVDVPELRAAGEPPQDYVSRVALDKARAGLAALGARGDAVVLGADTEVVLDDEVFGKPAGDEDAAAMLRRLSGRTHAVVSAVWAAGATQAERALCVSRVRFAPLDEAAIAAYVATGEPFGKAGGYAIQGRGAALVEYLEGSYSGVMGLPLFETARLLRGFGLAPGRALSR